MIVSGSCWNDVDAALEEAEAVGGVMVVWKRLTPEWECFWCRWVWVWSCVCVHCVAVSLQNYTAGARWGGLGCGLVVRHVEVAEGDGNIQESGFAE